MMTEKEKLKEAVIEQLKTVYDPEIPVDIYELGLVYDVTINDEHDVHVLMTLTAPNCPVADSLPREVHDRVAEVDGVKHVDVELTFDPPWDQDMLSDEAKLDLGLL
ncbi:MAG: SUF system Fe-S cluster assembly protein [Bacteroidales bacterium]